MIYHQFQSVRLTAAADLSTAEGCFVTVNGTEGTASLTAASTTAANVYGLLDTVAETGKPVDVILPGHAGIVAVKLHTGAGAVVPGTRLVLGASGTATTGSSGTLVAVALAKGTAGQLVAARLVEPVSL